MKEQNNLSNAPDDVPCIPMEIGKTTYLVRVHFSETATETMKA